MHVLLDIWLHDVSLGSGSLPKVKLGQSPSLIAAPRPAGTSGKSS